MVTKLRVQKGFNNVNLEYSNHRYASWYTGNDIKKITELILTLVQYNYAKKIICHFIYWNIIAASLFITILVDNHANNRISLRQYKVRSYKYGQRVFSNLQMAWKKDTYLAHKYSLHIWNATIFFSLLAPYNRFAMSVSNLEHHMRLIWYMSSVIHVSFTRLKIQT